MRSRPVVVTALGIAQILAWGSSFYFPAVLAEPIVADTGWSLGWVVGGVSIGLLVAGLIAPRVGSIIERRGRQAGARRELAALRGRARLHRPCSDAAGLSRGLGRARRRHGHRPLRRGVRRARQDVRQGGAHTDHQSHAVRRVRQHGVLAAERVPGGDVSAGAAPVSSMPLCISPSRCRCRWR